MTPTSPTPSEVKRVRLHLGLTQKKLAFSLGVHPISVSEWESARHSPPSFLALAFHHLLHSHSKSGHSAAYRARQKEKKRLAAAAAGLSGIPVEAPSAAPVEDDSDFI